jgi:hypothetical protein
MTPLPGCREARLQTQGWVPVMQEVAEGRTLFWVRLLRKRMKNNLHTYHRFPTLSGSCRKEGARLPFGYLALPV